MQNKDTIKALIGKNLRRLRTERKLTQDQLGGMLEPPVDGSHIAGIEAGNGVSDQVLARLCNALKVEPWEFSWTDRTPVVVNDYEKQVLDMARMAQVEGVAEEIMEYALYRLGKAAPESSSRLAGKRKIAADLIRMAIKQGKGEAIDEGIAKAIVRKETRRPRKRKKSF